MANKNHLKILRQGVKVWNRWREQKPEIKPDLSGVDLSGLNLFDVNFRITDLAHANLRGARLDADLTGANLKFANLEDAQLTNADLGHANLSGANLKGTDLTGAMLVGTTFAMNDLSMVKGLAYTSHFGSSSISIDTIYFSKGRVSKRFLREAGVPENFITKIPELVRKRSNFHNCFISFAESDERFSEKLYEDLKKKGVQCWRWKEDARWGNNLTREIDDAIRMNDKVVIVCTKQSLRSPAVIREIERALQREDEFIRQGKAGEVLFPIRLDDYVLNEWKHYRQADVIAKNIGNFKEWKKPTLYRKALNRLLRDLRIQ